MDLTQCSQPFRVGLYDQGRSIIAPAKKLWYIAINYQAWLKHFNSTALPKMLSETEKIICLNQQLTQ